MEFVSDVGAGELVLERQTGLQDSFRDDRYRPSFFELAAQDQLRDLLQPVTRYILSVLAQRNPRYLLRIVNRHDELYALLLFFLERHYLKEWGASFAENFYGLKRRRRPGVSSERAQEAVDLFTNHERLRSRDVNLSLLFLVGIPYLKVKTRQWYEQLGGGADSDLFADSPEARQRRAEIEAQQTSRERFASRSKEAFKRVFPYANTAYELWLLGYNIAYLFDKTPYYRPWLHWMGIDIRRMSAADHHRARKATFESIMSPFRRHPYTGRQPSWGLVLLRYALLVPTWAFDAFKIVLPTSIFFFKFLEWWYSSDYARSRRGGSGANANEPPLKPPRQLLPHPRGLLGERSEPIKPGQCPICRTMPQNNPTALPSGWVCCYRCVVDYISQHKRDPVTLASVSIGDLRRIVG